MNRNNKDNNTEAVKIANALKPFAKKWFEEWGQSCVRSKKMTVSTAPNGSVIGVKDAFSDTEIFIKYMSSCANAVVGDTVWCKWMFDNMQTLYADRIGNFDRDNYVPVSGGTFTGNVAIQGTLDITPRRCYANLSSAGWYRVMKFTAYNNAQARGASGFIIDIGITRGYTNTNNEAHDIRMIGVYDNVAFVDESSRSNTFIIDKIRYTYNGTYGYVDIHYTGTSTNPVNVIFDVNTVYDARWRYTAESLQSVANSPSGETIAREYSFSKDSHPCGYCGYASSVSTNFDDIVKEGYYYLDGTTMTNAPALYTWSYLVVFRNHSGVLSTQMVVRQVGTSVANIYVRCYSGTTPTWSAWKSILENSYGDLANTGEYYYSGNSSSLSLPTGTWKTLTSRALSAGRYVITANARFSSNSSGIRKLSICYTADTGISDIGIVFNDIQNAINGDFTYCSANSVINLTSAQTIYVNAYQDSGSNINTYGRMYIARFV